MFQRPLLLAAAKGHEAVVKLLLGMGKVDANVKDNDGRPPLWWAVVAEHDAIVKLLLVIGCQVQGVRDPETGASSLLLV